MYPFPRSVKSNKVFALSRKQKAVEKDFCFIKHVKAAEPSLVVITKKKLGKAHDRNYIRRKLKHAFYEASKDLQFKGAYIIYPKKLCFNMKFEECKSAIYDYLKNRSEC